MLVDSGGCRPRPRDPDFSAISKLGLDRDDSDCDVRPLPAVGGGFFLSPSKYPYVWIHREFVDLPAVFWLMFDGIM